VNDVIAESHTAVQLNDGRGTVVDVVSAYTGRTTTWKKNDFRIVLGNGRWRRVNGKHRDTEGDGHKHGRKHRMPEPVPKAWKLT